MDEMALDANPAQNLASFVTTYMEPEAVEILKHGMSKNIIDIDQYAQSAELQTRCVNMLADLFHAPRSENSDIIGVGTATIGSSEAIMLAGLAMKWRWREERKKKGLPIDKPNIVMGANVQVCWHKLCKYFDIEAHEAPCTPERLVLTAEVARPLIDENTIGVCVILGSTINGEYENVKDIHDMLMELNEKNGWNVPIHVDAASGGFIAPFIQPDLLWDFRLPLVKSINASGHKFGLVFAGIGWVLFREPHDLPEDLVFHVNYLGGYQSSFTLNFSKGASTVLAQYYQFLRLGFHGYKAVVTNCMSNSQYLRKKLIETKKIYIVDKECMPLVAFSLIDDSSCSVFDLQSRLKARGWIVPAYACPTGATTLKIMRVVVKQNFSCDMADLLVKDIISALDYFEHYPVPKPSSPDTARAAFYAKGAKFVSLPTFKSRGIKTNGVC
eukprot:TRINITY_DN543_c6_g1_i1.p1 TRINITY_DN543_c6_g1~~TRINITY_DN543_c6_g1_i1.p1  ORF type:complete len:465 (-),score=60.43 TRINITY_DN543_c6_g1_i1:41-1366(-)